MSEEMTEDEKIHKQFGIDLFNATWDLMDKPVRTIEEDDEMIHGAHASRYHWGKVGAPVNLAPAVNGRSHASTPCSTGLSRRITTLCAAWRSAWLTLSVILILRMLTKRLPEYIPYKIGSSSAIIT